MDRDRTQGLLGATAASRYLGVSRATLHRLVQSGALIPTERTASGYRRFSTLELHRFRSTQVVSARPAAVDPDVAMGESLRRQTVLLDLAERICGPHTVESMCMAAVTVARDALPSGDCASVWLVDAKGGWLTYVAQVGYPSTYDDSPFPITRNSITARALTTGQPVVCEDVLLRPLEDSDTGRIQSANLRAYVSVPMIGSKYVRGLLLVGCRHPAAFPTEDLAFLTRLTKLLAQSLETALHVDQYEQVYDTVQELSNAVIEKQTSRQVASLAASALGRLTGADLVFITVERNDSDGAADWLAAWGLDGLRCEDLPRVPRDPTLRQQLKAERRTLRIDDIHSYGGMTSEASQLAALLDAPMWHIAPLLAAGGIFGTVSLGFRAPTQLSQAMLRSISVIASHLSLALTSLPRESEA
jgi:hypothetical protein